jgi:acyl-CoA thioester hydrolase
VTNPSRQTPQLPKLPTSNIEADPSLQAQTQEWFEYPVTAQPHHTDYAGVVWHGNYLTWMEAARVEYLRSLGINFAELVAMGCELPVVELSLSYHRPVSLGESAIVKTRLTDTSGVRLEWDYRIESVDGEQLFVTGTVTLVGVDREKGKIVRQLPPNLKDALVKVSGSQII